VNVREYPNRNLEDYLVIKHPFRYLAILAAVVIVAVITAACGSGSSSSRSAVEVAPSSADAPSVASGESAAKDEDAHAAMTKDEHAAMSAEEHSAMTKDDHAAMSEDEHAVMAKPDEATEDTAAGPETAAVTDTEPEAEPVVEAPALLTAYDAYGFTLKLDLGAAVESYGWTESDPSTTQGFIAFNYGGVNTNLVWGPPEERTPLTFLADTYNVLRASQPETTFESISDGDITVNDQSGVYGGFRATGTDGSTLGGGLIGAWLCPDAGTAFRMTLTGEDATLVQLRFDRLLENFTCASSS
jgi:hypothetical protein